MELTIKGTPNGIKKALFATSDSKECNAQLNVSVSHGSKGENFSVAAKKLNHVIEQSTDDTTMIIKISELNSQAEFEVQEMNDKNLFYLIQESAEELQKNEDGLVKLIATQAMKNKKTYSEAIVELRRNKPISTDPKEYTLFDSAIELVTELALNESIVDKPIENPY
ncbi:hypothetical protein [Weissella soli]|uniref:hypothetical protein n=1 Tax=Weissella soli TaxID=155866 RepID=UPI0011BAEBE8|nr:hypothetical protein [Weissella soli]QEA34508.1 hypothetical protein FGL88_01525 [Weissella soli]